MRNLRQRVVLVHKLRQLAGTERTLSLLWKSALALIISLRHQGIQTLARQTFFTARSTRTSQRGTGFPPFRQRNGYDGCRGGRISSTSPLLPLRISMSFFITSIASHVVFLLRIPETSISSRSRERLNFIRPTADEISGLQRRTGSQTDFQRLLTSRRLARAHHAVDFYQRACIVSRVDAYRFRDVRAVVQIVGEQRFDTLVMTGSAFS